MVIFYEFRQFVFVNRPILGQAQAPILAKLARLADILTCSAWTLTLIFKDINWFYWKSLGVEFWLQNTILLTEATTIASIVIGISLPWLSTVTTLKHRKNR